MSWHCLDIGLSYVQNLTTTWLGQASSTLLGLLHQGDGYAKSPCNSVLTRLSHVQDLTTVDALPGGLGGRRLRRLRLVNLLQEHIGC